MASVISREEFVVPRGVRVRVRRNSRPTEERNSVRVDISNPRRVTLSYADEEGGYRTLPIEVVGHPASGPTPEFTSNALFYCNWVVCVCGGTLWRLHPVMGEWERGFFWEEDTPIGHDDPGHPSMMRETRGDELKIVNHFDATFELTRTTAGDASSYFRSVIVTDFTLHIPETPVFDQFAHSPGEMFNAAWARAAPPLERQAAVRVRQLPPRTLLLVDQWLRQRLIRLHQEPTLPSASESNDDDDGKQEELHANSAFLRYSRRCGVCLTDNPPVRAALTMCGHVACLPCVRKIGGLAAAGGGGDGAMTQFIHCPFCRRPTAYVRLYEDAIEEEESSLFTQLTTNSVPSVSSRLLPRPLPLILLVLAALGGGYFAL